MAHLTESLSVLLVPFLCCLVIAALHCYMGLHVLRRGVIFVDLALAQCAALGAAVGGSLLILGVIAGYRNEIGELFKPGIYQAVFYYLTAPLPRFSQLGDIAADIVQARPVDYRMLTRLLIGQGAFGVAWFAVGVWRFEKRDF